MAPKTLTLAAPAEPFRLLVVDAALLPEHATAEAPAVWLLVAIEVHTGRAFARAYAGYGNRQWGDFLSYVAEAGGRFDAVLTDGAHGIGLPDEVTARVLRPRSRVQGRTERLLIGLRHRLRGHAPAPTVERLEQELQVELHRYNARHTPVQE